MAGSAAAIENQNAHLELPNPAKEAKAQQARKGERGRLR